MARTLHVAANLLLIAALMMQSALAYAVERDCSGGIVGGFTCQGCSSCEVQSQSAKCPCCGMKTFDEQGECCSHGAQQDPPHNGGDSTATTTDLFAGMMPEVGPTPQNPGTENRVPPDKEHPFDEGYPPGRTVGVEPVAAGCNCVTAPEPLSVPVPHSPATELRDVQAVSVSLSDDRILTERSSLKPSFDFAHGSVTAHFSQIVFCVWRL